MREFNLEQALAGKPVVTRDGRSVTGLHLFDCKDTFPLYGILNGCPASFTIKGTDYKDEESSCDLFMKPEKVTKWVTLYNSSNGTLRVYDNTLFNSKEEAMKTRRVEQPLIYSEITFEV